MAAWEASQEDVEHNVHDETASSEKSTVDTSSTDTHTILGRNRLLRIAVKELQGTFHMYKDTMEKLIEKPVMILEEQTHNDISAAKGQLKESEEILTQAVILLKEGVKTMKEAMNKHSRKIDELFNYEECSSEFPFDLLPTDGQTLREVQNFTEHHDEIGRFYHEENKKLMLGISMSYHSNCFRCCSCNKCLDGKPFMLFEDDVYCIDDFYRNFPLKSVFCGQGSKLLQRRNSRAVNNINSLKREDISIINDIRPTSRTVKRSANSRYSASANGKPLNPIPSNSPIKSSNRFIVGKRIVSSSFVMLSDDRPGTTSSQKMIGNYRRQLSPLSKSKSPKSQLQEFSVQNENRGNGMIMQGVRSDLRIRSDIGPRKQEDPKQISDPRCFSRRQKTL